MNGDLFPGQAFFHGSRRLALHVEVVVDTSRVVTFPFFDYRLGSGNRLALCVALVVDTPGAAAFPFFNRGGNCRLAGFDSSASDRLYRSTDLTANNGLKSVHSDWGTQDRGSIEDQGGKEESRG